ncbi:MAG: 50S ribosomal protein L32 [Firmicutes bacterium]|nr:50S ribosomal protein L32 [Bacillota bacterium]
MGAIGRKGKVSKARRDKRKANWKLSTPSLARCSKCGALIMPHRVCPKCGTYNKRQVLKAAEE